MEVSSLRDRRLVALFATIVIVGSGAAAAVVDREVHPAYRVPSAVERALGFFGQPEASEPHGATAAEAAPIPAPAPVVVAMADDAAPVSPSTTNRLAPASDPAPKVLTRDLLVSAPVLDPDGHGHGPRKADGPKPPKPDPAPKPEPADDPGAPRLAPIVVAASDPGPPLSSPALSSPALSSPALSSTELDDDGPKARPADVPKPVPPSADSEHGKSASAPGHRK